MENPYFGGGMFANCVLDGDLVKCRTRTFDQSQDMVNYLSCVVFSLPLSTYVYFDIFFHAKPLPIYLYSLLRKEILTLKISMTSGMR